ncbi:MAG: hypothetical protein AB7U20_13730 [Planctomycetaceae bacterium]
MNDEAAASGFSGARLSPKWWAANAGDTSNVVVFIRGWLGGSDGALEAVCQDACWTLPLRSRLSCSAAAGACKVTGAKGRGRGSELRLVTSIRSSMGPGSTAFMGCETTSAPLAPMNRVTSETLRCSPPTSSQGIQML